MSVPLEEPNLVVPNSTEFVEDCKKQGGQSIKKLLMSINAATLPECQFSPLNGACWDNSIEAVKALLDDGVDVNAASQKYKFTALHTAISRKNEEIAMMLIDHNSNLGARTIYGLTPLHTAAHVGASPSLIKYLVNNGAEPFALTRVNSGTTPYELAIDGKHQEICNYYYHELVKQSRKASTESQFSEVSGRNISVADIFNCYTKPEWQFSPLNEACWNNMTETVKSLLAEGHDVNAGSPNYNFIPLNTAIFLKRNEIAIMLIDHSSNLGTRSKHGFTPLHTAAHVGAPVSLVKYLVKHGAEPFARTQIWYGKTPYQLALESEHYEICKYFFKLAKKQERQQRASQVS